MTVLGDRWSLLIVRDLVFKGKSHYREFASSPERISTNILANRLARLGEDGILTKSRDPDNASSYVYRLTEKGKALVPVLLEMTAWSATYDPQPAADDSLIDGAPPRLLDRLASDREALIQDIVGGIPD
ncbi:MAG: helix-turn-helix domain-containing protein [Rubricoccaceae bacterium]